MLIPVYTPAAATSSTPAHPAMIAVRFLMYAILYFFTSHARNTDPENADSRSTVRPASTG